MFQQILCYNSLWLTLFAYLCEPFQRAERTREFKKHLKVQVLLFPFPFAVFYALLLNVQLVLCCIFINGFCSIACWNPVIVDNMTNITMNTRIWHRLVIGCSVTLQITNSFVNVISTCPYGCCYAFLFLPIYNIYFNGFPSTV